MLILAFKLLIPEWVSQNRKLVGIAGGLLLFVAFLLWLGLGVDSYSTPALFSRIELVLFFLTLGSVGLTALTFAAFPKIIKRLNSHNQSLVYRLGAFGIASVVILLTVTALESQVMDPPDQEVLSSLITSQPGASPTHYLFFTVNPHYEKLSPNESVPLDVVFKALDPQTVQQSNITGAYSVALDPNHEYFVGVNVRSVGFDLEGPPEELLEPRQLNFNQELRWPWLISPKEGREGTEQNVIFEAYIYDSTDKNRVVESPYAVVKIAISTPLGLPRWLVSPQTGIGTIIGGIAVVLISWILEQVSAKSKETQTKRGYWGE